MSIENHPMSRLRGTPEARALMDQVRSHRTKGTAVAVYTAAERRALAAKGHALKDGSYPIANATDLKNAAILAKSGHGNVAAAKALIARRAKELGVANPLDDNDGDEPPRDEKAAARNFMKRRAAAS